jgi:hypothetical protein
VRTAELFEEKELFEWFAAINVINRSKAESEHHYAKNNWS